MYKNLRILFCILAAITIAAAVFIFVYLGWVWGLTAVIACLIFIVLMFVFKNLQEDQEKKENSLKHPQDTEKDGQ